MYEGNRRVVESIPCGCGCGGLMPAKDRQGRTRRFLKGHSHSTPKSKERAKRLQEECARRTEAGEVRRCPTCDESRPVADFLYGNRWRWVACCDCSRADNAAIARRRYRADYIAARKYGLTVEQAHTLRAVLFCEICGRQRPVGIDHDHKTGYVRGSLCANCNKALGLMNDNPARLISAVKYLQRHLPKHARPYMPYLIKE